MSKFLLSRYRSVVDALLQRHDLTASASTRDNLAMEVAFAVEPAAPANRKATRSSGPGLQRADRLAKKLLGFQMKPPSRRESLQSCCERLGAELSDPLVALELGLLAPTLEQIKLVEHLAEVQAMSIDADLRLAASRIDASALQQLIDAIALPREKHKGGRPEAAERTLIRTGYLAWRLAGRTGSYTWEDAYYDQIADKSGRLKGELPAFLRDLIGCGAGAISDATLLGLIADCNSDQAMQALIARRKNSGV